MRIDHTSMPSPSIHSLLDEMNRFVNSFFIFFITIASTSSQFAQAASNVSVEDAEELRTLLVDLTSELNSNTTEVESNLMVDQLWPELIQQDNTTTDSSIPALDRIYSSTDPASSADEFPNDFPKLDEKQAAVDIATLSVLNSLFNVISGESRYLRLVFIAYLRIAQARSTSAVVSSLNLIAQVMENNLPTQTGSMGLAASNLGLDANIISRFFSRAGFGLNVANFGLKLTQDAGKWAATNTTTFPVSAPWSSALKDLRINANLKSNIQSTIQSVNDVIKQFKELSAL